MAQVSLLGSTLNTNSGTHTVVATPAVGDLIVIVVANTGNLSSITPTDNNSDGNGTYTAPFGFLTKLTTDSLAICIRTAKIGVAASTTFTHAPGTTTGGGLVVLAVKGMSLAGSNAYMQSGGQSDQAGGGTPTTSFNNINTAISSNIKIKNPVIIAIFNGLNPPSVTLPTGYINLFNNGYATPATGLQVLTRDDGETNQTVTMGGTSASAFGDAGLELNYSFQPVIENYKFARAGDGISVTEKIR